MATAFPGGGNYIRKAFALKGMSQDAIELAVSSITNSTLRQYESHLRKWHEFCQQKQRDPFAINMKEIQDFLTAEYVKGASYGTINSYRSALSLILGTAIAHDIGI